MSVASASGPFPVRTVRERFARRLAVAVGFTLFFGLLAQYAFVSRDPWGPLVALALLPASRAAWLLWSLARHGPLMEIAPDGLTLRHLGRIDWEDIVGFTVRVERVNWAKLVFLDLCIRRPSRYDLPTNRRATGRDGFSAQWINVRWADLAPARLSEALHAARARSPAPFAAGWALDMTGAEIHAELRMASVMQVMARLDECEDAEVPAELLAEMQAEMQRGSGAIVEWAHARVARRKRLERRAYAMVGVIVVLLVASVIARLLD